MTNRRTMTDFPRNEAGLVDEFLGTSYDVVKAVYDNLEEFQKLYDVLDEIDDLAQATIEEAMIPVRIELTNYVQQAQIAAGNANTSALAAASHLATVQILADQAAASADRANAINVTYPFTFVSGQATYNVNVISGDPNVNTTSLALWVEGALEFDFTVNSLSTFTLNTPSAYLDGTQMRIILNGKFDGATAGLDQLAVVMQAEFESSQQDRTADFAAFLNTAVITPLQYGAVGGGVVNDTAAFNLLETSISGKMVDLQGKTYLVSATPVGNKYFNGFFLVGSRTIESPYNIPRLGDGKFAAGVGAMATLPLNYDVNPLGWLFAYGPGAMGKMQQAFKALAIGDNSQGETLISRDNISIGTDTLRYVQAETPAYDQTKLKGTRNVAIQGNALRFLTSGYNNVAVGRNAGQCLTSATLTTTIGAGSMAGYAPIGLSGEIENWSPLTAAGGSCAYGYRALTNVTVDWNSAFGVNAGAALVKGSRNSIFGTNALPNAEISSGFNGNTKVTANISGSYSQVGNTVTCTVPMHGAVVGGIVGIRFLDGGSQTFQGDVAPAVVTGIINADTYTITHPTARTASGTMQQYFVISLTAAPQSVDNSVFGHNAALNAPRITQSTIMGASAVSSVNSADVNTTNVAALGYRAGSGWTSLQEMSFFGMDAGRFMQDGSVSTGHGVGSTCLGYSSRISGPNQVQIGGPGTTPYASAALQIRSDERDKIGFRDLSKPLELIRGIKWFEYRKNERSLYVENIEKPDGTVQTVKHDNDGSLAGTRFHAGVKAQQVEALCISLGIDWAGLQHHAMAGGLDIYTVAYEALIPYMGYCIQHLLEKQDSFEARLQALESAS